MYIIPYFLEKEAKNLLKIKLNKIISNITDDFIENLFVVNPNKKYQNIMINLEEKVKESVLETIKETIKILDNLFLNCDTRKCNISRQDVYNWISKWDPPDIEYQPIESDPNTLYIMVDEKYIHEQIKAIIDKDNKKS